MATFEVPAEYGLVLATLPLAAAVHFYHFATTGGARREAKIPYPAAYATEEQVAKDPSGAAYRFNCAQRAQANYTEQVAPFMGTLLVSGIGYPKLSAVAGATWAVGRVLYAWGYTKSGPKGRVAGSAMGGLSHLAVLGMSLATAWGLVSGAGLF